MKVTYIMIKERGDLNTYKKVTDWLDDHLILWYDNSYWNQDILGVIIPERLKIKTPHEFDHLVERYYDKYK